MTAPKQDPVRAFSAALTPTARRHLELTYQTIPLIHAGCERHGPEKLARIVCNGVGGRTPANAAGLMLYRLRREAGIDDQEATI